MLRGIALICTVAVLATMGCRFPPDIDLRREASVEEIVGTWELSADTLKLAKREGYSPPAGRPHEVIFHADGTCVFRSITEFAYKVDYLDASGVWRLEHERRSGRARKNELMISIDRRGIPLYLTESSGRLQLWYFWGDPDEWEFVRYDQKANPSPKPTSGLHSGTASSTGLTSSVGKK